MPFCTECGNSYPDEAKFCPHCGQPNSLLKHKRPLSDEKAEFLQKTEVSGGGIYGLNINDLPSGTSLENGRYTILEKLGQGGFGIVYKASDANYDGQLKALKVIYSENYSDRLVMHKLKTEAKNMININHPNVVRLYDTHFQGNIKFLDMEYVDGGDLVDLMIVSPDNKIPEARVWELAEEIAQGMQAIHEVNLIHQDLKPENILLTAQGKVKITDFGISEHFRSSKSRIEESQVKGTYVYASPEQLVGKNVGKEADVWSFGATLYHILTGKTLYSGATSSDVIIQIERREFEPVLGFSDRMNALLKQTLVKDYKNRLRDFTEVLRLIEDEESYTENTQSNSLSSSQPQPKSIEGFVFVEGGTFQMGSTSGERHEKPVHSVTLSDFFIGKYEVTQAEYQAVMGSNPSYFKGNNNPVEQVSWYQAVDFCNKKSIKDGLEPVYSGSGNKIKCDFSKNGYRLPTEAEWEFAARGGNKSKGYTYSGSNNIGEVAEYEGNNDKYTKAVGGKKPNELGIYDMSGNVWEWCWDLYGDYSSSAQTDPRGPNSGSYRVFRGGSWISSAAYCRVAFRYNCYPADSYGDMGFRLARRSN